jgi:hypothetical protein
MRLHNQLDRSSTVPPKQMRQLACQPPPAFTFARWNFPDIAKLKVP